MWAVQGILAALYERHRTGKGRLVECSLLETAIGFSSWTSAQWLADHQEPTRQGSRHRQNAPYQRMRTKNGYLMIGAAGQSIWERCAAALGHQEWSDDPRFATNEERMANRAALEAAMERVLATETTEHRVGVLEAAGVPCGPVYDYAQMFADPQVRHRGLVQYASDAELGEVAHVRTPIRIGDGVRVRTVAPRLGQHNGEIFARLGLREEEIAKLREKGVVVAPLLREGLLQLRDAGAGTVFVLLRGAPPTPQAPSTIPFLMIGTAPWPMIIGPPAAAMARGVGWSARLPSRRSAGRTPPRPPPCPGCHRRWPRSRHPCAAMRSAGRRHRRPRR